MQSFSIEKMSLPLFTHFLDILDKYRGDFLRRVSKQISEHMDDILGRKDLRYRYEFEKMDADSLKGEPHDSPAFLQFSEYNQSV